MFTLAATATPIAATHSIGLVGLVSLGLLALVIVTAGYLALCWLRPFTRCPHPPHSRRAWRCRRCDGTGTRLRAGRHVIAWLRNIHRRSN